VISEIRSPRSSKTFAPDQLNRARPQVLEYCEYSIPSHVALPVRVSIGSIEDRVGVHCGVRIN